MSQELPKKFQGENLEEVLLKAKSELGVATVEELDYKVIKKGGKAKGFLKKKITPWVIEVISVKNESQNKDFTRNMSKEDKEGDRSSASESSPQQLEKLEKEIESNIDGHFKLEEVDNELFLIVYPPGNEGKPVKWVDVKKYLENFGYKILSEGDIVEVIRKAEEKRTNISEYVEEIRVDGSFEIKVEDINMAASLKVYLPQGKGEKVALDTVMEHIKERQITHGLKTDVIEKAVEKGTGGDYVVIAAGTFPREGKDGEIKLNFEKKEAKPVIKEDGTVDYYNVENVTNVKQGDILASRIPPEEGEAGIDVFGEEVEPPPPKDEFLKRGKNTIYDEEEDVLKAETDGQVIMNQDGTINVFAVYEINGDLDISTGNIDFVGNVVVKGGVKSNIFIRAEGDVEIGKSAENCFIEAEGNVYVKGGIQGKQKGYVKAGGEIVCKFIENAAVEARGQIKSAEAIMHSNIKAKNVIVNQGKRGLLVGGNTTARDEVVAKAVGSNLATATTIEVGFAPELREKMEELREESGSVRENIEKTKKAISILEKLKKDQGKLPPDKEKMLVRLQQTQLHLSERIHEIDNEKEKLEKKLEESYSGKVKVTDVIYPGVKIVIGNVVRNNDEIKKRVTFYLNEEGEIRAE